MKKLIFLTWTEKRSWLRGYGKPMAALWVREGGRARVAQALEYVKAETRKGGDHQVHVFSVYDNFAESKASALRSHTTDTAKLAAAKGVPVLHFLPITSRPARPRRTTQD